MNHNHTLTHLSQFIYALKCAWKNKIIVVTFRVIAHTYAISLTHLRHVARCKCIYTYTHIKSRKKTKYLLQGLIISVLFNLWLLLQLFLLQQHSVLNLLFDTVNYGK